MLHDALSKKQIEYVMKSPGHRWSFKGGATRSGKTYLDFKWIIPSRIRERIGKDGLTVILGVTKSTIERNVLSPMRDIYGDLVGEISSDNTVWLFGEKCYALGAEKVSQVSKVRGASFKYCYGDEVADWSKDVFDIVKSRMDKEYSCFDGTFNPQGPTHWLKKFLDSDADIFSQKYTIDDNPFLSELFVKNLKLEYEGSIFYGRYILGEWVQAEGLIYPMFQDAIAEPPDVPPRRYALSIDYGTQNAFAALLWSERGGIWYAEKEYYYSGRDQQRTKTDNEYYEDMLSFVDGLPDDRLETIIDPSAASFIALLVRNRRFKVIPAINDVINGIRETATAMTKGLIKISPKCDNWKKEAAGYVWDAKSPDDRPVKIADHLMDSCRYFVKTKRLVSKPKTPYVSPIEGKLII